MAGTTHPTTEIQNLRAVPAPARLRLIVAAIAGLATLLRIIQNLADSQRNPFASQPIEDALVYWNWSGEIARGHWIGTSPFFSGPLYPYLLAVLRIFGAGMGTVYGIQAVLYGVTIWLLGIVAYRRFGFTAAWLTAVLFALLTEPAYFAGRLLAPALQAFLIAWLLYQWTRLEQRSTIRGWLLAGVIGGLLTLALPPALLIVMPVALWAAWKSGWTRSAWAQAGAWTLGCSAAILPATIHNYLACHELILVSAQSGVTFAQGNAEGALGRYKQVAGVSQSRTQQNLDVLHVYEQETHQPPNWKAADRHFFSKGLRFLTAHPDEAARLLGRKFWWYLTSTNYGDIYCINLEGRYGLTIAGVLAPLPASWLIPPALAGLFLCARPLRKFAGEIILFLLPLIIVLAFFYTPRYRFPALPLLALGGAGGIVHLLRAGDGRGPRLATLAGVIAVGPLLGLVNTATSFDRLDEYESHFGDALADALQSSGDTAGAANLFARLNSSDPTNPLSAGGLADTLSHSGKPADALRVLEPALQKYPNDASLRDHAAFAYMMLGRTNESLKLMQRAVELSPRNPRFLNDLVSVYLALGQPEAGRTYSEQAVQLRPDFPEALLNLANIENAAGNVARADQLVRRALEIKPNMPEAWRSMAALCSRRHDVPGSRTALRRAIELSPSDPALRRDAAWWFATTAGLTDADHADGLAIATALVRAFPSDPALRDVLAAALAANGRFEEAAQLLSEVLANATGLPPQIQQELQARLALYRSGKPFLAPLPD